MRHMSAEDSRHLLIPGKCRYTTPTARAYQPRRGKHPRSPAIPASADPTAGMPGTRNGNELGHEAEEENNQMLDEEEIREAQRYEPGEDGSQNEEAEASASSRGVRSDEPTQDAEGATASRARTSRRVVRGSPQGTSENLD